MDAAPQWCAPTAALRDSRRAVRHRVSFLALALLACSGDDPPRKGKTARKEKSASGVVEWEAPSAGLLAADRRALDAALATADARPRVAAPAGADDIVVIVLDTVRADHLGLYGYDQGTSPTLDAWSTGARVYDNAVADGPWTLPSHASMFTGLPTISHAARSVDATDPRKGAPLAESFVTVAERLQAAGWRTVGVAGNRAFLHSAYGLSQGFDAWMCEQLIRDPRGVPYNPADRVIPLAQAALEADDDRPLFLFVNLMDAHTPWQPRAGFVKDEGLLRATTLPGHKGYREATRGILRGEPADASVLASWNEAYDAEIRWMDSQLGQLLPSLDTVPNVFFLADHGEYLGEHDLVEHGKDVYEAVLHIPFLVKSPAFEAGRDDALVQTHDLAWMILQAAGLPPDPAMEHTGDLAVSEQYYALKRDLGDKTYGKRFDRIRRAFRVGDEKLIVGSDGTREQYRLDSDPGETRAKADLSARFDTIESEWLARHPARGVVPASEQTNPEPSNEELRALGYVE